MAPCLIQLPNQAPVRHLIGEDGFRHAPLQSERTKWRRDNVRDGVLESTPRKVGEGILPKLTALVWSQTMASQASSCMANSTEVPQAWKSYVYAPTTILA
jgi:hypothetical protein